MTKAAGDGMIMDEKQSRTLVVLTLTLKDAAEVNDVRSPDGYNRPVYQAELRGREETSALLF